ncbi:MAG: sulfite exporter TauE/SafE family protein [Lentisphaeria bacterium]|nr:sulfite exporter TauE/SafE family protein [Lentisphaeria bacterium]
MFDLAALPISPWALGFLCAMTFLAGFVDSIAGGGGLISIPAYLLTGLPPHLALGGNKFSACSGTCCAILRFWKHRRILWREALTGMAGAFAGSVAGSSIAFLLPAERLKLVVVCALPVVGAMVFWGGGLRRTREVAEPYRSMWRAAAVSVAIGFAIGMYDGIIGPGTGTFLIIAATRFLRLDLVTASGNAKVINFASNLASVLVFAGHGEIPYPVAIPAALASIAGGYFGVGYCVRFGGGGVRKMMAVVLVLLFCRLAWDVASPLLTK